MQRPDISSELKWLREGNSRRMRLFALWHGPVLVLFLALMAALHLYLASLWAGRTGLSFGQVWQGWLDGISPAGHYSGVYLKALEQLDKCAILGVFAVFILVTWPLSMVSRRRHERLLAYIESFQTGAVPDTVPNEQTWPPAPGH